MQYMFFALRKGAIDHKSLPCALLLARILDNLEGSTYPYLMAAYEVFQFCTEAGSRSVDVWDDPKEGSVTYVDTINRVFGEEARFVPFPNFHDEEPLLNPASGFDPRHA